jgi:DNA-binding transcriptional regulator YhcF (GntR family)
VSHRHQPRVEQVKQRLVNRLRNGFYKPGDRFLSNRDVAEQFGISYQTAHRLIGELCAEGVLQRRPQSGTYVPGTARQYVGVQLVFRRRAEQPQSFGWKLHDQLVRRFEAERIDWQSALVDELPLVPDDRLPVVWESPATIAACAGQQRMAVMINDRPQGGMESLYVDSVSTDDFSGGACAAQLLETRAARKGGFVVVAGPADDARSNLRAAGFCSIRSAEVLTAGTWFFDAGYRIAPRAVRQGTAGIFCCNDQLASAIIQWCVDQGVPRPSIVGFDDAPVAEPLNLTTIGIPWDELVHAVVAVVKRRLAGDRSTSSQQTFVPRPVVRAL